MPKSLRYLLIFCLNFFKLNCKRSFFGSDSFKINVNFFWHEEDKVTLTSKGWVWCHPTCKVGSKRSIICLPELHNIDVKFFDGLCTDDIDRYTNKTKNAKD